MPESEARALGGVEAGGGGGVGGDGNGGSGGGGDGEEEGEKKKGGGFRQRKPRHTFDLKEEYYRLAAKVSCPSTPVLWAGGGALSEYGGGLTS